MIHVKVLNLIGKNLVMHTVWLGVAVSYVLIALSAGVVGMKKPRPENINARRLYLKPWQ
jgi:hypothetical protein